MKTIAIFVALLFAGLACSSPIDEDGIILTIGEEYFPDLFAIYTAQHNIVKLLTPLNSLNFNEDIEETFKEDISADDLYIFFVQADKNIHGKTVDKGLYVLKNGQATKLLDHGRDAAASSDDSKQVFFGASDGIYVFNAEKNKAEKYGTVNEDIVSIEKENGTDVIYILTADHKVYKIFNEGNTKEEVTKIKNAIQITIDSAGNLFFVDIHKHVKVLVDDKIVTIKGLPNNPTYVQLIRPPIVMKDAVTLVAGKKAFTAYANGTAEYAKIILNARPSAYSMEATFLQYYAYNKKIYEYNVIAILHANVNFEDFQIKNFLADKMVKSNLSLPGENLKA